jgi:hypothetical protein
MWFQRHLIEMWFGEEKVVLWGWDCSFMICSLGSSMHICTLWVCRSQTGFLSISFHKSIIVVYFIWMCGLSFKLVMFQNMFTSGKCLTPDCDGWIDRVTYKDQDHQVMKEVCCLYCMERIDWLGNVLLGDWFIHLFIQTFIHTFIHSFNQYIFLSCLHRFSHSFIHWIIRSCICTGDWLYELCSKRPSRMGWCVERNRRPHQQLKWIRNKWNNRKSLRDGRSFLKTESDFKDSVCIGCW